MVCLLLLLSMMVHCAGRLGIISYLYHHRHAIAYEIGLIAEIPIALCNGDYFAKQAPFVIQDSDNEDEQAPVTFTQAKEIILFVQYNNVILAAPVSIVQHHETINLESLYSPPILAIFHPPCKTKVA